MEIDISIGKIYQPNFFMRLNLFPELQCRGMKDTAGEIMRAGIKREGTAERNKYGMGTIHPTVHQPGVSSLEIQRLIADFTPETPQSIILICITSTLFVLQLFYFLSIEVICWEEKNNTTGRIHIKIIPAFPKTTWEAILIINYSRPPNIS